MARLNGIPPGTQVNTPSISVMGRPQCGQYTSGTSSIRPPPCPGQPAKGAPFLLSSEGQAVVEKQGMVGSDRAGLDTLVPRRGNPEGNQPQPAQKAGRASVILVAPPRERLHLTKLLPGGDVTSLCKKKKTPQVVTLAAFSESRLRDSNPGPALYESAALPAELSRQHRTSSPQRRTFRTHPRRFTKASLYH